MKLLEFALLICLAAGQVFSQSIDQTYNEKIREYTTDERFLPSSVLNLIDHPDIPNPRKHFGQIVGAPLIMHSSEEIYAYYKILADASPLAKMEQVGTSEEGRPIYILIITSESNMDKLGEIKEDLAKLADPRTFDKEEDAKALIRNTKLVYYINSGLHSTEMGPPEMVIELAYRLITDPSELNKRLLEDMVVLINPVSEPDGRDKQVDWYHRYSKDRKDYNDGFPRTPPYWGKYVYHDNNRDGLQVSQQLTKAIFNIFFDWHPTVMLDLHESVPLLYISTGTGPYNEQVDPITISEWQIMAHYEQNSLAAQGLPGVFTWAFYDGWWPGYEIWVANNHNSVGRFYETFGNAGANTYLRDLRWRKYAGAPATTREWYRPDPPSEKVYWSSRNNTNYMQAGVLAALRYASDNRLQLLSNFYQKGRNNIVKGRNGKVKGFVIPHGQRDPNMSTYLINQLIEQRIEVHEAENGDFVVKLDQPYGQLAYSLLSEQRYPKEAKFPPYDDIAWTYGYLFGVEVESVDSIAYDPAELDLLHDPVQYNGTMSGKGRKLFIPYKAQNELLPALYKLQAENKDLTIQYLTEGQLINGDSLNAGSILIEGMEPERVHEITKYHGLDLLRSRDKVTVPVKEVELPRIAIYHSWYNTQDEGWARFTFDHREIPYTNINKDHLRAGKLNEQFDLILIPRTRGDADRFIQGINRNFGPLPYTKTQEYPSHGYPDSAEDITGGPGLIGMAHLQEFVDKGGVLVSLDNSSSIIAEAGLSPDIGSFRASGLFHPGSVVTVKRRSDKNPILFGYPEVFHVFRGNGSLVQVADYDRDMMMLQYGTKPLKDELPYSGEIMGMDGGNAKQGGRTSQTHLPYVLSGMVRNEQSIIGHGAIFNVPVGEGRLIAFTFDPLHRFLNHHDAPLLWNAIMHWDHL